MLRKFKFAAETISFQNSDFGKSIEKSIEVIFTTIKDKPTTTRHDISKLDAVKDIESVIFARLGLKVKLVTDTTCIGAIMVFPVNRNHVLLNKLARDNYYIKDQDILTKEISDTKTKGTVSLTDAKLGGAFSLYVHSLYLDMLGNFEGGLTAGEVTAVMLHELGHAFTYYELSDRLSSTNQILADLAVTTKSGADTSKRVYLFKELADKLDTDESEWDDILQEPNRIIFGTKLFKKYIRSVGSLMHNHKYDDTASESLADNFAAKFGYGRELLTGLDKHSRYTPERHNVTFYILTSLDFLYSVVFRIGVIIAAIVMGAIPAAIFLTLIYFAILYFSGSGELDMTYDELKTRYIRIRQQSIERISKMSLPKDDLKNLVDGIHEMDKIINDTKKFSFIFTKLSDFIFSSGRAAKEEIAFQGLLESLAHNDLFLKAAELQLIK